ncbi:MAG TPA: hypothetical protein VH170_02130 [Chthoniobacterales bacterium]|jgi:hypothetical protein|nr:hypothetical protein [Chthoniobacterales bacterium]
MRRFLIILLIVLAVVVLWLWRGRDLTTAIDRIHLVQTSSRPVTTTSYEGSGTGGILRADDVDLSLNQMELGGAQPSFGTTKDGELALSFRGKVFPFAPMSSQEDKLTAKVPAGDTARISIEHSAVPWPNFFEVNFVTGNSPKWKRHIYQKLLWRKANRAKLEMIWRYEQFFYPPGGWTEAFMTRQGSTGLIRVEISDAPR